MFPTLIKIFYNLVHIIKYTLAQNSTTHLNSLIHNKINFLLCTHIDCFKYENLAITVLGGNYFLHTLVYAKCKKKIFFS